MTHAQLMALVEVETAPAKPPEGGLLDLLAFAKGSG